MIQKNKISFKEKKFAGVPLACEFEQNSYVILIF